MSNNSQYMQMFFDESKEYIQMLNENILILEENPDDESVINSIFRAAHSLKGMSATMGFDLLTELTHKIENILDKVRNNELQIDTQLIDLLFNGIDHISKIVNMIKENRQEEESNEINQYIENLALYINTEKKDKSVNNYVKQDKISIKLTDQEKQDVIENIKQTDSVYKLEINIDNEAAFKSVRGYMVLKNANDLGYLIKSNPSEENIENDIDIDKVQLILASNLDETEIKQELKLISDIKDIRIEEIPTQKLKVNKKTEKPVKKSSTLNKFEVSSTVRVDIYKLDNLMNMVGELLML